MADGSLVAVVDDMEEGAAEGGKKDGTVKL